MAAEWDIVRQLLTQTRYSVNAAPTSGPEAGITPLWFATLKKKWDIVHQMLQQPDCNVNAAPKSGSLAGVTVLFWAVAREQWDIVRQMLLFPNCDVNAQIVSDSAPGYTPFYLAAVIKKKWDIVSQMLLLPGCNVNAVPKVARGSTPLWTAAENSRWDIVLQMLSLPNCNVNATPETGNRAGTTVLWWAAYFKQWGLVHELLRVPGVDVNAAPLSGDWKGKTALGLLLESLDTQKGLAYWLILLGAEISKETASDEANLANGEAIKESLYQRFCRLVGITDDKATVVEMKQNLSLFFSKFVEIFMFDDTTLPLEIKELICLLSVRTEFPELGEVPDRLIRRTILDLCHSINAKRIPRAVDWFSKKAFAWRKKGKIANLEPEQARFVGFKNLWLKSLQNYTSEYFIIINRPFRDRLFEVFKRAQHPLPHSQFCKIIAQSLSS